MIAAPAITQAQLVADGETNILDNVTVNVTGGVNIGANGSFTLLMLTNGAIVTSIGETVIGTNATASNNRLVVTSPGSFWFCPSNYLTVGSFGSYNQLLILDGGSVSNHGSDIGLNSSRSNLVLVSGLGSQWTPGGVSVGGGWPGGAFNSLVVSNGGKFVGGCGIGSSFSGSNNTVIVTGPGSQFLATSHLTVGASRFNRMTVTNGGFVGSQTSSTIGNYGNNNLLIVTGAGSVCTNASIQIGIGGEGFGNGLIVSNGGAVTTGSTTLCQNGAYRNYVTVSGANSVLFNSSYFYIGFTSSSNQLFVTDGGKVESDTGYIGYSEDLGKRNGAVVSGANSLWTNRTSLYIGYASALSQLVISNGGVVADYDGYVASKRYSASYSNQIVVTGTGSLWNNRNNLYMGYDGGGNQLVVSNGARIEDSYGYIGYSQASGTNVVIVNGAGTLWTNRFDLYVGYASQSNQLLITDGAQVVNHDGQVGNSAFSNNFVIVTGTGSVWRTSGYLWLDRSVGNRLMVSNSGTVLAYVLDAYGEPRSGKTITVAGGILIVTNLAFVSSAALSAGLFRAGSLNANWATNFTFNGGTLQTRNASFSDNTPFSFGNGGSLATFEMLNSGTNTFNGGLIISSNALLTGNGTVRGNVAVATGGTISPGDSNGQITIIGSLVLSNCSITALQLDAGGGSCDKLVVTTNITYGGTLQLTNIPGDLTNGSSFQLFSAKGYAGAFNNLSPASPGPGLKWNTNELSVDGVLRVFATTPPPPKIINPVFSGSALLFTATGGIPYDPGYVLSSTNIASPMTEWEFWTTKFFDASGCAIFTNPISSGESERYFRLYVE